MTKEEFDRQLHEDYKQSLEDLKNGNYIEFETVEELDRKLKETEYLDEE